MGDDEYLVANQTIRGKPRIVLPAVLGVLALAALVAAVTADGGEPSFCADLEVVDIYVHERNEEECRDAWAYATASAPPEIAEHLPAVLADFEASLAHGGTLSMNNADFNNWLSENCSYFRDD